MAGQTTAVPASTRTVILGMHPIHRFKAREHELGSSVADGAETGLLGMSSEAVQRCCGIAFFVGRLHRHAACAGAVFRDLFCAIGFVDYWVSLAGEHAVKPVSL